MRLNIEDTRYCFQLQGIRISYIFLERGLNRVWEDVDIPGIPLSPPYPF